MSAGAQSFVARGNDPAELARRAAEARARVGQARGALVFLSGELADHMAMRAEELANVLPGVPTLFVGGHGVLSEAGEIERHTAAAGLVWSAGSSEVVTAADGGDPALALAKAIAGRADRSRTAVVFLPPREFTPSGLEPLGGSAWGALFGAGTSGDARVLAVAPGRPPELAHAGALLLGGTTPPVIAASPACRLLMPLAPITATRGPMLLEIDGQRALDVLSSAAQGLEGQPLVFLALAAATTPPEDDSPQSAPPLLLRAIHGVDPSQGSVLASEEVRPGMLAAFAVRDAAASRQRLEASLQRLSRETAGAAPRFGLYMNCAGRGSALYDAADVDVRILRARFPDLPFAGMHSAFEIAPHEGLPTLELYTGVFALFTAPS